MKYTFYEVGIHKQETATNILQADRAMRESCGRCYKQGYCEEVHCPIHQAHKAKLLYFEAAEVMKKTGGLSGKSGFYSVRKYHTSPIAVAKKTAQTYLTRLYNKIKENGAYGLMLAIDDAAVAIEGEHYKRAISILRKHGLVNAAAYIEEVLKDYIK